MTERLILTWQQVARAITGVIEQIRGDPSIVATRSVMAVPRGGLLAGSMVAYALDCPCWLVNPRDPEQQSQRRDLVIVDDICDTGATFTTLRQRFPYALYIAAFAKPKGILLCDYYGEEVPQDTWIVFPYAPNDIKNRP